MAISGQLLKNKNAKLVLTEMEENQKEDCIHSLLIHSLNKKRSRSTGLKMRQRNLRNTSMNTVRIGN